MYMEEQVLQQKNIAKMRTLSYLVMYAYSVITKGVYLVHPNYWEEYYKTGEGNYQVELEWPVSTDNSGVEWKSSDESIATVDSKGVVTRKKKGTVTITAVRGEFSDSVVVKILKESFSSKDGVWKYRKLTDSTIAICGYMGEGTKKSRFRVK